uniref:Ig-like domain-containing protein n=1 Tax=Serinus canaria TaxID=9135 RepID=A0A8C9N9H1_SERCA
MEDREKLCPSLGQCTGICGNAPVCASGSDSLVNPLQPGQNFPIWALPAHAVTPLLPRPSLKPPGGQVALGDSLVLSCKVAAGTGPLSFSWHREGSGAPLGTGPSLELQHVGDNDSGQYQCRVSNGENVAETDPLNVTVLDSLVLQVPARALLEGDTVTLRCRRQQDKSVTSVSFYHNRKELGGLHDGTELSLSPLQLNHSGSYRCEGQVKYWASEKLWLSVPVTVTVTVHSEHPTAHTLWGWGPGHPILFFLQLPGNPRTGEWGVPAMTLLHPVPRHPSGPPYPRRAPQNPLIPWRWGRSWTPSGQGVSMGDG